MKQVLFNQKGQVVVEEVPEPLLGDNGVLVRAGYSLISSGTETAALRGGGSLLRKIAAKPEALKKLAGAVASQGIAGTVEMVKSRLEQYTPAGYSAAGIVVARGKDVRGLEIGDRVACAGAGYANHAEVIFVPRNLAARVPDGVELRDAAFATVGAIAMHGVRRAGVGLGETVVVIGLGLIGQLTVQLLHAAGCRVIGIDPVRERVELALNKFRLGIGIWQPAEALEAVRRYTGGVGADAVVICAATASDEPLNNAFRMVRRKGRVVVVGAVGMHLERQEIYAREADLLMSTSYGPGRYDPDYEEGGHDYPIGYVRWTENRNIAEFLRMLGEGKLDAAGLITGVYPIHEAERAYAEVTGGQSRLAILLEYNLPAQPAGKNSPMAVSTGPGAIAAMANPIATAGTRRAVKGAVKGRVNVAVIGAGAFATGVLLPNLKRLDVCHLRAVVSRTGYKAKQIARRFGADYCTSDYQEVLADEQVDLVCIATPHNLHAPLAIEAAAAGKDIFVEKPLGMTLDECATVDNAVKSSKVKLVVGFNRRFSPLAVRAKVLLARDTGPKMAVYRVNAGPAPPGHWTLDPVEGGGRILGEAVHFFDLLTWLFGEEPVEIHARSIQTDRSSVVNTDNLAVTIRFARGSVANLLYSCLGDSSFPKERLEIFSAGKVLVLDDFKQLSVSSAPAEGLVLRRADKGHFEELKAVLDLCRGARNDEGMGQLAGVAEGVLATWCALEALKSGEKHG